MITLSSVSTGYIEAEVLQDIDLAINQGEIVTVIGGNGAGKSTLLRLISGLLRPWRGSVHYEQIDIGTLSPAQIVRLGVAHVPEGRKIFPGLTVEHNLRLGAYLISDKATLSRGFEQVYAYFPVLYERKDQIATTLSGGEQQMLAIARALMSNPKILLLDEPTMGLAPLIIERVHQTLVKLRETGIAMLLVEQNAAFAMSLADRVAVLQLGRIVASGPKDKLPGVDDLLAAYMGA